MQIFIFFSGGRYKSLESSITAQGQPANCLRLDWIDPLARRVEELKRLCPER
jgi:hypothetical protein